MLTTSRVRTLAQAQDRYGHIDLASGHWPDEAKWIKPLSVPPWFPKWTVLDTQHPVSVISCNLDMHGPLTQALMSVHAAGLNLLLRTYDGCFNIRRVRGLAAMSTHSYGLAIDLNASENPLAATKHGFYDHPEFVKCFTDQGFTWGGNFHGRKDPMHFSLAWE